MHEIENGTTSCISQQVFGASNESQDDDNLCVDGFDYFEQSGGDESSPRNIVTFTDLAGSRRYFKTTISGLTGQFPDYGLLVVDATLGVQPATEEHLHVAVALDIDLFVVITKTDCGAEESIKTILKVLTSLFDSPTRRRKLSVIRNVDDAVAYSAMFAHQEIVPVITVSNVSGHHIDLLQSFVSNLAPRKDQFKSAAMFYITESHELEGVGTVVTGIAKGYVMNRDIIICQLKSYRGCVLSGAQLLLGPDVHGKFIEVVVDSIEIQRVPVKAIYAGQMGAMSIRRAHSSSVSIR